MKDSIKQNWKAFLVAGTFAAMGVLFAMGAGGCSTVNGIAHDLEGMSNATRNAMTGENE